MLVRVHLLRKIIIIIINKFPCILYKIYSNYKGFFWNNSLNKIWLGRVFGLGAVRAVFWVGAVDISSVRELISSASWGLFWTAFCYAEFFTFSKV
jgi:hypothetical protein